MPDIVHDFPIRAAPANVYAAISTPAGLDRWWTQRSKGHACLGAIYELSFGPAYDWRAVVRDCQQDKRFDLELTEASDDWVGTHVQFHLAATEGGTLLRFAHVGWPAVDEHFRVSSFCWAMYLRILRRNLEYGEEVAYEQRLEV